ncbi:hypothetical protein DMUE_0710 [Dictyocoela muelleri]|nr:hypothetical protein DMUE_0710 [Dictyocoela muelleri]
MTIEKLKSKYQVTESETKIIIKTKISIYEYNKNNNIIDNEIIPIDNLFEYITCIESGSKIRKLKSNYLPKIDFKNSSNSDLNIEIASDRKNILFLFAETISAEVECLKCKKRDTIYNFEKEISCKKCHSHMFFSYFPIINNHYLGHASFKNCKLVVFNQFKFIFSCECNEYFEYRGEKIRFSCQCGRIIFINIIFIRLKSTKSIDLPGKGTCKHYKKSLRWFRFPCCNNLYPCDICHDDEQPHVAEIAKRMICGLCKKEQSVKSNCECGMELKTRKTAFWEGGKGNRDKTTMSKKDKKKFKK